MPPPITPIPQQSGNSILGSVLSAVPIAGPILGAAAQLFTNAKNKRWQERQYGIQRRDALADWEMQNLYNSPEEQMKRLTQAGLNPNLVYGNGVTANSTSQPRSSNMGNYRAEVPQMNISPQGLSLPIDMAIKQQQLQNLKVANAGMLSGITNKNADTALKTQGLTSAQLKYDIENTLKETTIGIREAYLQNLGVKNAQGVSQTGLNLFSLDFKGRYADKQAQQQLEQGEQLIRLRDAANARAESNNVYDLKLKARQVINTIQTGKNLYEMQMQLEKINTLKDLDIFMKSAGFDWNDPVILRQLRMKDAQGKSWR